MSFVDFEPKPQPRSYDLWDNPHPYGVIAALKRALNVPFDVVNWSKAATGTPPSTEEEAFLYNLARDRGIAGAFGAASNFGPGTPQFVRAARDAASRAVPQTVVRDAPRQLSGPGPGNTPGAGTLPPPDRLRNSIGLPSSGGSVPSVPPPTVGSAPSGGVLARLRELDAMELQASAAGSGLPAPVRDPNFRQLSRFPVLPALEAAGSAAAHSLDLPDFLRRVPSPQSRDSVERTGEPPDTSSGGSRDVVGGKGGGSGGGDRGGGGDGRGSDRAGRNYKDECDDELAEELRSCESYKGRAAHRDYYHGCVERAKERWVQCYKNGEPNPNGPRRWRPGTDEQPGDEETWINHRRSPRSMRK